MSSDRIENGMADIAGVPFPRPVGARERPGMGRGDHRVGMTQSEIVADLMENQRILSIIRGPSRVDPALTVIGDDVQCQFRDSPDEKAVVIEPTAGSSTGAAVVEILAAPLTLSPNESDAARTRGRGQNLALRGN
jgi:hypothetical protein